MIENILISLIAAIYVLVVSPIHWLTESSYNAYIKERNAERLARDTAIDRVMR